LDCLELLPTKALISPLAHIAPAGFLFLGEVLLELALGKLAGLLPAVIQDRNTKEVLMVGFLDAKSLARTQSSGEVHFFSRSRNRLWKKGETSGHVLKVKEIRVDCDADTLLIQVETVGPGVCHEGYRSCFFRVLQPNGEARVVEDRTFQAADVYGKKEAE
jgi:phosphoribosyl-AMP cyclohydrolase